MPILYARAYVRYWSTRGDCDFFSGELGFEAMCEDITIADATGWKRGEEIGEDTLTYIRVLLVAPSTTIRTFLRFLQRKYDNGDYSGELDMEVELILRDDTLKGVDFESSSPVRSHLLPRIIH